MASSERWAWEEQCDTLLCEAIAALGKYNGSLDTNLWRTLETRGPLTVSRHIGDETSTRLAGTGYIHGRLEDITRGLYCDNDDDLVGNEAVLSGAAVLDGAVLQALEKRGPDTPFRFAGVKWVATHCGGVPRELLTFERMGMTLDSDNTEVAYHIVYAIPDHPDWPTATQLCAVSNIYRQRKAPVGIPRLEPFALCYLYRKVSEDLVLCFILGEYWGQASCKVQRESENVLAQRVLMVSNALVCCEAKILTKMLDHCKDAPIQQSKTCLRCRSTRGTVTDPLRICAICRKSVCSTCLSLKTTSRLNEYTKIAETQAYCLRCLIRANIPTASSDEPRVGLRNADHDRLERRQRRHHENERRFAASDVRHRHATSREPRIVANFIPPHSYNYDGLMRSASMTSRSAGDNGRHSDSGPTRTSHTPRGDDNDSRRSQDDLYLRGSFLNSASTEAERRYQRHLERDKRLSMEDFDERPSTRESNSTFRPRPSPQPQPRPSSRVSHRDERRALARPSTAVPATMRDQKTVREFYRDLYTEL